MAKQTAKRDLFAFSLSAGEVKQLHTRVESDFSKLLNCKIKFRDDQPDLAAVMPDQGLKFSYNLVSVGLCETMDLASRHGTQESIFRISDPDKHGHAAWVAWNDVWTKYTAGNLVALLSASLHFYWGKHKAPKKLVVRAEWDHMPPTEKNGTRPHWGKHGQPHWHIEREFLVGRELGVGERSLDLVTDLEQPVNQSGRERTLIVDPKNIHLAMAGWNQSSTEGVSTVWQKRAESWKDVCEWAKVTLEYAREQFAEIRPAREPTPEDEAEALE